MASAMSSVKHLAVMFGAMSIMKAVNQEDPHVIACCRLLFGTYLFATWALHTYIHVGIARNGDRTTRVTVPPKPPSPFALPPPPPPSGADGADAAAAAEYDAGVLAASKKALLMNAVILTGVHLKMGTVSPLVLTSLTGLTRLVDEPLFQLYVLGRAAAGKLARPFAPEVNPLMALLGGGPAAANGAAGTAAGGTANSGAPGAPQLPSAGGGAGAARGAGASRVATLLGAGSSANGAADDDLAGSDDDSDDEGHGELIPDASEDEDEGGGGGATAATTAKKHR
ncbi:hypothetical protein MMPV_009877 [Pyropia vietnamensis]